MSTCLDRLSLCQASELTTGHRWLGAAAVIGFLFVIFHLITIIITCSVQGFDWGAPAWCLDLLGYFAGFGFMFVCRDSSNKARRDNKMNNQWICVWAVATIGARVLDTLMLFGIVKLDEVYTTPSGIALVTSDQ